MVSFRTSLRCCFLITVGKFFSALLKVIFRKIMLKIMEKCSASVRIFEYQEGMFFEKGNKVRVI